MSDSSVRSRVGLVVATVTGPVVATGLGLAIGERRTTAAALVYLLGVLAVASSAGLWAGIGASGLSFLGLNFFFTPPRRALSVAKSDDLIALVVFVTVGVAVSTLVESGRAQRARAERREFETRSLYALSSRMLDGTEPDQIFTELVRLVRRLFGLARCEVHVIDPEGNESLRASEGEPSGGAPVEFSLAAREHAVGRLVVWPPPAGLDEAERRVAEIFARQTASLVERAELERRASQARVEAETNKVRRALLSAVSHDFRTPLASIKAALTGLPFDGGPDVTSLAARELVGTALEETERLERLVTNLLDLTRIRSGALAPDRSAVGAEDLVQDALSSLRALLAGRQVSVVVRPDLIVDVDPVQVGQVLRNVLENAAKFSPNGTEIRVAAARWQRFVEVRVADRGPGVALQERDAVFEEFYRASDARAAGTGLGLAVAKAIVVAHGGAIKIEDTPGGGATVVVRLPAARAGQEAG
jgi:two-component system, OmpR family, sensor histidine kinase KdpD